MSKVMMSDEDMKAEAEAHRKASNGQAARRPKRRRVVDPEDKRRVEVELDAIRRPHGRRA